jgi:hypothetical protein
MAYVYCRSCWWQQDDFYDEHYNPANSLKDWDSYLFGKDVEKRDEIFSDDAEFVAENGRITTRELIAQNYERYAKKIRNMKWVTMAEFEKDNDKFCPLCNSRDLGID